jgi:hypothetical protein
MYSEYACYHSDPSTGICEHFGPVEGLKAPDIYFNFTPDMATIDSFSLSK